MSIEGSQTSQSINSSQVQVEVHVTGASSSSRASNEALCLEILGMSTMNMYVHHCNGMQIEQVH